MNKSFARFAFPAVVLFSALTASLQAHAQNTEVRVYNRSSEDVLSIRVSPTYEGSYGPRDLLGRTVLSSGYNIKLDFSNVDAQGNCVLDVLATGSAGSRWTRRINVCTATAWTLND